MFEPIATLYDTNSENDVSNAEIVLSILPQLPAVALHQSNDDGTKAVRMFVSISSRDVNLVLRIRPECF